MAELFVHPIRIYWEDTDAGGIVFYANYLKFFERARTEWLRHLGLEQQHLRETTGGMFVVTHTSLRYLLPARLDDVIQFCWDRNSRLGYFPALYRKVTHRVKDGIAKGEFQDGSRMEELDICFAGRYLDAWALHRAGELPTRAWLAAFRVADDSDLLVIQHLLLGMNAHINLDLGIAAARTAPGPSLESLQADFNKINHVLAELTDGVKKELEHIWPPLRGLDQLVGRLDDVVVNFSMTRARGHAWGVARRLAVLPIHAQLQAMAEVDTWTSVFAEGVVRPPMAELALKLSRREEHGEVRSTIDLLM